MLLTYFIEVEGEFARYRTVQPSLQISRPILGQYILTTRVPFANSRHAGIDAFAAVYVFHGGLTEKEEHVATDVVRSHEIGF